MKRHFRIMVLLFSSLITFGCAATTLTTTQTSSDSLNTTSTTTTLTTTTTSTPTTTTQTLAPLLIENGGFEAGNISGWTVLSGTAFSNDAVTNQTSYNGVPYGKSGTYLLGKTVDELIGKMASSIFTLTGSGYITFKLGGGYNQALTYLSVVDADTHLELARFGNTRFNDVPYSTDPINHRVTNLVAYRADLQAFNGKEVYLLVVDDSTANHGYLTIDDIVSYYRTFASVPSLTTLAVDIKPVFETLANTPSMIPNGEFLNRTLENWVVIGEVNSFLSSHVNSNHLLSNRPNETAVGVLRSSAFKVSGSGVISFRMGGTKNPTLTYLVVKKVGTNEEVFRTYSNRWIEAHEENTHLYHIDLSLYRDEALYLEIIDNSRGDWGLVTIEQIRTFYEETPMVIDEIAINLNEKRLVNPSYNAMRTIIDALIAGIEDETERITFQKTFYSSIDGIQNFKGDWPGVLHYKPNGMTFVYTGDIHAMWLRDSSAQVLPYLQFMTVDEDVLLMVKGLLKQQFEQIRRNPYANAFNEDGSTPEEKFEIDSLCYPIWLAYEYYTITGDASIFDQFFVLTVKVILDTFLAEQNHSDSNYRINNDIDRLVGSHEFNAASRLIWSGYRPSDDVTFYKFFIPGNMFAVATLEKIVLIFEEFNLDSQLKERADTMATEVRQAIELYGVYNHPTYGKIYVFETTGMSNDPNSLSGKLLMDAANIPSLLSAPWVGYLETSDTIYQNTRDFILSTDNPYYYIGTYASGIGDPHDGIGSSDNPHPSIPVPWHMSLAMQALTSTDIAEIRLMVDYMIATTGGTYVMHEAFNANNPSDYSRDYFTWPCSLFAYVYLNQILHYSMD
jgi:uncharacterized protein